MWPLIRRRGAAIAFSVALLCVPSTVPAQTSGDQTLRIALTQEPAGLNPIVATLAIESDVENLIFSGLTHYDDRGNLVPDLAHEVPTRRNGGISADSRTITYHLVHNAFWQDGVPVTSED